VNWDYELSADALAALRRLGPSVAAKVVDYLDRRIRGVTNPRLFGKPLRGRMKGLWRYRVEDYRLLCRLEDRRFIVLVVEVDHRSRVYDA
jgi:mRNA interferase RelE/StbE